MSLSQLPPAHNDFISTLADYSHSIVISFYLAEFYMQSHKLHTLSPQQEEHKPVFEQTDANGTTMESESHCSNVDNSANQPISETFTRRTMAQSLLEFFIYSFGGSISTCVILGEPLSFLTSSDTSFLCNLLIWYLILWCPLTNRPLLYLWKRISVFRFLLLLLDDMSWSDAIVGGVSMSVRKLGQASMAVQMASGILSGSMGGILYKTFDMKNASEWSFRFLPEYYANIYMRFTVICSIVYVALWQLFEVDLYWIMMSCFMTRCILRFFEVENYWIDAENALMGGVVRFFVRAVWKKEDSEVVSQDALKVQNSRGKFPPCGNNTDRAESKEKRE